MLRDYWNFPGREERDVSLAVAMSQMTPRLQERFLANMSRRMSARFQEKMAQLAQSSVEELPRASRLLLREARSTAARLLTEHQHVQMIYPEMPDLGAAPVAPRTVSQGTTPQEELATALSGTPVSERNTAELLPLFKALSRKIRQEGLLALEELVESSIDDDFVKLGLRMIVDGEPPSLVREALQARIRNLPALDERRLTMIAAAVTALGEGRSPVRVEERCRVHLVS